MFSLHHKINKIRYQTLVIDIFDEPIKNKCLGGFLLISIDTYEISLNTEIGLA